MVQPGHDRNSLSPSRFALFAWAASRLFYGVVGYVGTFFFRPQDGMPLEPHPHWYSPVRALDMFVRWDALHYLNVAANGYTGGDGHTERVAFFPVFPLLLRAFASVGAEPALAAVIFNHLVLLLGLIVVCRSVGDPRMRWAAAIILLSPATFYFTNVYPDALVFCLFACGLVLARDERPWAPVLGALAAAVASAARPQGIALAALFFFVAIEQRRWRWLVASAVGAVGLLAYMAYLQSVFGDALKFTHVQAQWGRDVGLFGPVKALLAFHDEPDHYLTALAALAAIVLRVRRKAPWPETAMLAILLWLPLSTGRLLSFPRFFLTMVPAHLELAHERVPRWLRLAFVASCAAFSIVDTFKLAAGRPFL